MLLKLQSSNMLTSRDILSIDLQNKYNISFFKLNRRLNFDGS